VFLSFCLTLFSLPFIFSKCLCICISRSE